MTTTGQRLAAFFDRQIAQVYLSANRHQPDSTFANLTEALKDRPVLSAMTAIGVVAAGGAVLVSPPLGLLALGGGASSAAQLLVGLYGMAYAGKMTAKANATRSALPEEAEARAVRAARPKREWRYAVGGETLMSVSAEHDPGRIVQADLGSGRVKPEYILREAIGDSMAQELADRSVARAEKPGSWGRAALYILTPAAMAAVFGPLPVVLGAAGWYAGLRQDAEARHARVSVRSAALAAGEAPLVPGQDMGPANPGAKADWSYLRKPR